MSSLLRLLLKLFNKQTNEMKIDDWKLKIPKNEINNGLMYKNNYNTLSIITTILLLFCVSLVIYNLITKKLNKYVRNASKVLIYLILLLFIVLTIPLFNDSILTRANESYNFAPHSHFSRVNKMNSIGLSTGGAKDVSNFRENIKNGYLPIPTDITYEGLFYDYYFDTGLNNLTECKNLFCPSYSYAITNNPITNEKEYYLSVGLNSNIKQNQFKRNKLNIVIVLDISGSMASTFNKYYYDSNGNRKENNNETKSKQQIANEAIVGLLDHLNDFDRFGMVVFDGSAYLAKPFNKINNTDMNAIKTHILDLKPRGATNFEAGYKEGTKLFDNIKYDSEYDNRIIFLTDAMPNIGSINENQLLGLTKSNANNEIPIYTTFVGIGVDFNTKLIEYISKIKGCNYYSVHNSKQFNKRLNDEFEYMVTPLVFDLNLNLESNGYQIVKVYGSPEANEATGNIIKINTLFPSSKDQNNETKGGIVLLKLKKLQSNENDLKLSVSYFDRMNKKYNSEEFINVFNQNENNNNNIYMNNGIRKSILLSRYAQLIKQWIIDERLDNNIKINNNLKDDWIFYNYNHNNNNNNNILSKWERKSKKLTINQNHKTKFKQFLEYFEDELKIIKDETLKQESQILKTIIHSN